MCLFYFLCFLVLVRIKCKVKLKTPTKSFFSFQKVYHYLHVFK